MRAAWCVAANSSNGKSTKLGQCLVMVVRTRIRAFFRQLALFIGAGAAITYFGFHAFSGDHGIMAQRHYDEQKDQLSSELDQLQRDRRGLERRIALLKSDSIDPDILEEKSREMLGLTSTNDVIVLLPK
jgi:cell division protein FtsB